MRHLCETWVYSIWQEGILIFILDLEISCVRTFRTLFCTLLSVIVRDEEVICIVAVLV